MTARKPGTPKNLLLTGISIFLTSAVLLFLGMDRRVDIYDEGLVLTNAMRVAAGLVPHRDFYVNYGPAQFYVLAWLFDLFGRSLLVERVYDLILKALIVALCFGILSPYCRRSISIGTAAICGLWLFSLGLSANPIVPVLLLSLIAAWLMLAVFGENPRRGRLCSAGAVAGLVALFRYDVGAAVLVVHLCTIGIAATWNGSHTGPRLKAALLDFCSYIAGFALVFLPVVLLYLAVAPTQPFIHDILLYPSKYYVRARHLPFPGPHLRTLDELAVYLPLLVLGVLLSTLIAYSCDRKREPISGSPFDLSRFNLKSRELRGFYLLFSLLSAAMYFKGLVRVGPLQMLLSIVPALLILSVLFEGALGSDRGVRIAVTSIMAFSVLTATWSALKESRRLFIKNQTSVLQELISPPGPAGIRAETSWCHVPNALHSELCFLVDPYQAEAIAFVDSHTSPSERIFVGLPRHDKIYANNNLIYFVTDRLPATKWSHFDPDLQSRADIQTQMIREIDSRAVRYILLDREFDNIHEPNDSDRSSGITLLDDYIRQNYRKVETFDEITVWQRN